VTVHVLCPSCGLHHEVVRVLDEGLGEGRTDVYQVAPLATCDRSWVSDKDVLEARARYGEDAIIDDDDIA
jgi:hypothetical protein